MNFVFTSAGDNTYFDKLWLGNNKKYDVYVIYYKDNDDIYNKYKSNKYIKHVEKRKGSKFQNFLYFYNKYFNIIEKYDRFFILDDDIIFNVDDINKMFEISATYNLEICGPSFIHPSKISHAITKHVPGRIITYTNFVEVNTMLFSKSALINLMKYMSSELIGWGIDYIAIWANGMTFKDKYAIVHYVKCINPDDKIKNIKIRELYHIENAKKRDVIYNNYVKKIGIYEELKEYKKKEYKSILFSENNIYTFSINRQFKNKSEVLLYFK
jgi:hypothetical protein